MRTATCSDCAVQFDVQASRGKLPLRCTSCNRVHVARAQRDRMARARAAAPPHEAHCVDCQVSIAWFGTGRPPLRCEPCKITWTKAEGKRRQDAWRAENAEHVRARNRRNYQRNAVKIRARKLDEHYRSKYGITRAERNQMLADQGNRCRICDRELDASNLKAGVSRPHVDHCHGTGRVRGILCSNCNTMIGLAAENPRVLLAAVEYLTKE